MKITVTGTRGIPNILGGVETHCEELFPRIAEKGFDVTLIRRKGYVNDKLTEYKGVKLIDIKTPRKKAFEAIFHTLKAIWTAKFKLKADVVHIHAIGPALVVPVARMLGLKVVFTHHGPDYDRDKWGKVAKIMLRLGERMGVEYANEVIVISTVINESIKKKHNRTNAHLIYNGVSEPIFHTDWDYLNALNIEPGKYFFAMGRFVPEKNFHRLIHDFASLDNPKGYRLVLAGDADFEDDYAKKLKKTAKENGVVLTGFIKGTQLQTLLSNAFAFVLPSSHEGLPISLLEAMSYGLPVIVSNIPANKAIPLPDNVYFEVNDENDLMQKLQEQMTMNSKPVSYNMGDYNWDKIAEQTVEVYKKL